MQDKTTKSGKMKVCFVVTKGAWGGAGRYVYDLATNLPKDHFEPFIICGEGEALPQKLGAKNIRVERLLSLTRDIGFISEIKSSWNLLKIVNKEKPEVLHLNSPKAAGFGAVAGRLTGVKKIIYTVHGFAFNEDRNALSKFLIWLFSWITILLSHKTIVIAERERKQAIAMPFVKNKIVLIHNGIEKINFKEKETARAELLELISNRHEVSIQLRDKATATIVIGTLAELHKNKGLEYAIEALAKLSFPFVFFALGEGEERKNLEQVIKKHSLEDRVFLVGFIKDANQYLKAFDIFTLTSVKEGLPYTILEAGQAGLPIIASRIGGIPDVIENGASGILVTKGRSGEITRAIEHLMENSILQKQFGEKLKEKVETEFSLEQMLEKTLELYS